MSGWSALLASLGALAVVLVPLLVARWLVFHSNGQPADEEEAPGQRAGAAAPRRRRTSSFDRRR